MDAQGFANPGDRPLGQSGGRDPDMSRSLTYAEMVEALKDHARERQSSRSR